MHPKYFQHVELTLNKKLWTSLVVQTVKNLPAMQEMRVPSLGLEDPLEKEMAAHSNILVLRIPWTEEPGVLWFAKSQTSPSN